MPKISVIVPIYNVEKYLRRCVDSILNQTFSDFELILVDDGSPDNCGKICDEYAVKDRRIVVIHQKNGGLSTARNAGIDWAFVNSNSQYLSFIDSDDWVHPDFLEFLYRAILKHNVQISVCNVEKTDKEAVCWQKVGHNSEKKDALQFYMGKNVWATVAWNKLYAKNVFKKYRYPVGRVHEDEFLTYKLLYDVKEIAWIEEPLYEYYSRSDSIMGTVTLKRLLDKEKAITEQFNFWKSHHEMTAWQKAAKVLACCYYWNIQSFSTLPNKNKTYNKKLNKKLRFLLLIHGRKAKIFSSETAYIYEFAFPRFMQYYWLLKATETKLKKDGFFSTVLKTVNHFRKRS